MVANSHRQQAWRLSSAAVFSALMITGAANGGLAFATDAEPDAPPPLLTAVAPLQSHAQVCQCTACQILGPRDPNVLAGSNPPGGGVLSTSIPAADPNGVFASTYVAGTDSRQRTARSLLVYLRDVGTPDMYNKTLSSPVLGATTRYEYLQKVANDQRQWLAVNSGGRMDSTYDILDSGGVGYKNPATQQRWTNAYDVLPSILAANGITQSNYDYIQLVYDDVWGSPYFEGTGGAAGTGYLGNGYGTQVMWSVDYARRHELGHNLGFMHANSLRSQNNPANGSYSTSLYLYDFANQTYVSTTSVRNNPTDQLASPTIGLSRIDYGNPLDVMAQNNNAQFGTRDKQRAGWLDERHFAVISGTANGAVQTISLHDPAELVPVTIGSGSDIRYGVARGYADVPYTATIYRKGQEFVADASGTSGYWNTVLQKIDLTTVQLTGTTYGIEFRLDDAYVGVIQAGQTVSERDIAQYNRIITDSPWATTVGPDLVNDLHAGAPDNPARYRSTWFDLGYVSTGTSADGTYASLQVTTNVGATLGGKQWDASSGSGGAQDGSGTWSAGGAGWRNVDAGSDNQTWTNGDTATFGAASGAAGTVTVSGSVAARSLTFKPAASGSYALQGGTIELGTLGVNAEADATVGSNLSLGSNQVWEIVGGRAVTLSGSITGNGKSLTTLGGGSLVVASSGTLPSLRILEGAAIQRSSQQVSTVTVEHGTRYDVEAGTLVVSESARIRNVGSGQLRLMSGTASSAASPDISFTGGDGRGTISSDMHLGDGRHAIVASRGYWTDYDVASDWWYAQYASAGISGDISGPGGIDYVGSETSAQLVLSGSNSFTGDLRIQRGSIHLIGGNALAGAPTVTFDTSATSGDARLYLRGENRTVANLSSAGGGSATIANAPSARNGGDRNATLTVNSTVDTTFGGSLVDTLRDNPTSLAPTSTANPLGLVKTGAARLTLTGNNTYTGPTVVSAGELRVGTGGTQGLIGSGAITANGLLSFNRSDAVTLSQAISGTGIIKQMGSSALRLTGSGPFAGTLQIDAGSLDADGSHSTAAVTIAANAGLTGSGSVGAVTMAGGATLTGVYGSTLTTGGLTLADTTVISAAFDRAEMPALFQVNGGLVLDGLLDVTSQDVMWAGVYRLFNYTGSLTNNGLQIRSLPADVASAGASIQTGVAGQVNFYNGNDTGSNFWNAGGNGAGVAGGSGVWQVGTANWSNSAGSQNGLFERLSTLAVFQATSGTVTVNNASGQVATTGFQFATNGYRLTGGGVELRNGSNGTAVLRVGDGSAGSAAMTATIDSVLSGTAGVTKTDAGTAVLAGANTFTGGLTVLSGTIVVPTVSNGGAASGLGQSSAAAANLVLDGGAVRFTAGTAQSTNRGFTLGTSGGTLDASPSAGGSVAFTSGSAVAFTGSGPRALTLAGAGSGSLAAVFGDGTGGASSLVKTGTGTWVLTGLNTYTGTTAVLAGKLQIGNGGASGNIGSAGSGAATNLVTVASGATLEFNTNGTINNNSTPRMRAVAGAGTIVVNGGGTFINFPGSGTGFAESNSWNGFSGSINVIGGSEFRTLRHGSTAMGTGQVTLGDATTSGILAQTDGNWVWTNAIAAVGSSNQILNRSSTSVVRWLKLQGVVSGSGGLLLTDATGGMSDNDRGFILTGANTLSGAVTVNAPVRVGGVTGNSTSLDAGTGGSLGTAAVTVNSGKTLTFSRSDAHSVAATISGSGAVRIGSGGITGVGTQTVTVAAPWSHTGGTTVVSGSLIVGNGGTAGSIAGNISNASALRFNRSDAVTYSGTISGAGSVTQAGAGSLRFTAPQAYTGVTTVSAGRLLVDAGSSISSSAGVVIDGSTADFRWNAASAMNRPLTFTQGTISGTGAIAVAVTAGANRSLAPGNSPGTQTYTAGLTLTAGGSYVWEIDDALGTKGMNWDSINVSGGSLDLSGLSAGGTFTLNLTTLTSGGSAGALANYVDGTAYTWRLFDTTSLLLPSSFAGSAAGVGSYTTGLDVSSLFGFTTTNWYGTQPSAGLMSLRVGGDGRGLDLVFSSANTTVYWSPAAGAGGNGTWSGGQSWATSGDGSGSAQAGSTAAVVFGGTAGTVTTSGTVQARRLDFRTNGYTVTGGTGSAIALSGSAPAVALGSGVTATIGATVSGTGTLAISGSGSRGRLNLTGDSLMSGGVEVTNALLSLSGSVQGGVSLAANAALAGTGRIGGVVAGSGVVSPGNSPGIITAGSVDPSSGLDFVFEFGGTSPDYAAGSASVNDVLRLTGETPFVAPLTAANTKTLFLNFTKAALGLGTVLEGGFFTDADIDFISMLNNNAADNAGFAVYVLGDGLGTDNSLNGQGYYNWRNPTMFGWTQSLFMSTAATTADFGSGPVVGRVMQLVVAVPEPSAAVMAGATLVCLAWSMRRRGRRA